MTGWDDIPGVRVGRLSGAVERGPGADLCIAIEEPALAARLSADVLREVDEAWETLQRGNPRLFDGPMLTVLEYDVGGPGRAAQIRCARSSYRFLAAAGWVATGARMLGVNGIVTGEDDRGERWALLARRGENTRVYPGMWEFAPAGGIDHGLSAAAIAGAARDQNERGQVQFGMEVVRAALAEEAEEELAVALTDEQIRSVRAVAICEDEHAPSVDVIVRMEWGRINPQSPPRREAWWEYSDVRWVRVAELGRVEGLSLMTQGLVRFLSVR